MFWMVALDPYVHNFKTNISELSHCNLIDGGCEASIGCTYEIIS
jgi:hypothetical protein